MFANKSISLLNRGWWLPDRRCLPSEGEADAGTRRTEFRTEMVVYANIVQVRCFVHTHNVISY